MKRLIVIAAALVLSGCALLQNSAFDAVLQAGIDVAVGQVLDKNPAAAALIAADATALAAIAGGSTATVAQLEAQADAVIAKGNLPIADKAALETIVAASVALIQAGAGKLNPATAASLQLVFTDIANAASLYATAQGQTVRAIIRR